MLTSLWSFETYSLAGQRALRAAAWIALIGVCAPAGAASAKLEVGGEVAGRCSVSSEKSDVQLGDAAAGGTRSAGLVGVICNLVDARPTVRVTSANRGLLREGGSEILPYLMRWDLSGQTILADAAAAQGDIVATFASFEPGVRQAGELHFIIRAANAAGLPAGTYSDVVSINVFP